MTIAEKFAMPSQLTVDEKSETDTYGKFFAQPLEKGFGHTLGNALRRILLSSLEGISISSIKIENVAHEFTTIPDVLEDVTDIVLNFKKVLFQCSGDLPRKLELRVTKTGPVTARDIQVDSVTKVLNPDQLICTIDKERELIIEMEIVKGRGFRIAEDNKRSDQPIGVIPIDCLFSPVRRVGYSVHDCRVGQRTDYDRLEMEITTDGRLRPGEAIKQAGKILLDHLLVFVGADGAEEDDSSSLITNPEDEVLLRKLLRSVQDLELSVRSQNCLNSADIRTLGELVTRSEAEMLKYRNFGQKSLTELREKVRDSGLELNMEIPETVRIALQKDYEKKRKVSED
jgi:DNA-directed RNA polymerase subunit alpha